MLQTDGMIDFSEALLDLVARALEDYERQTSRPLDDTERVLALSYLLGLARSDLRDVCSAYGQTVSPAGYAPDEVFEGHLAARPAAGERLGRLAAEMMRRGWRAR